MKKFIILAYLLAMIGNVVIAQQPEPITIKLSKSDVELPNATLSDFSKEISYIPLETHPDFLIGGSNRYYVNRIPNVGYLIYNWTGDDGIMLFDEKGNVKCKVGRIGEGPGEYTKYYRVVYDEFVKEFLIFQRKKVLCYDLDGFFQESVDIEIGDLSVHKLAVKDAKTWMFTYSKFVKDNLNEVGVLITNRKGEIIHKYELTDKDSPGSWAYHTQRNFLYQRGDNSYYSPLSFDKTYVLTDKDEWELAIVVDHPFKEAPVALYLPGKEMDLNAFHRENGLLHATIVYGDYCYIYGSTPYMFNLFYEFKTASILTYTFNVEFKKSGIDNDIDGGMPFYLRGWDDNGYALEMVDAIKFIELDDEGLLRPDGKSHGKNMNLKEVLETVDAEDNPVITVIRVSHLKK